MNKIKQSRIGIVGDGRLAKNFKYYFSQLELCFHSWDRHSHISFEHFALNSEIVLLMISDDAISPFIETHSSALHNKTIFHFSGALSYPGINCCHPLMTFSEELLSLEQYESITLIGEKGKEQLRDCLPALINPSLSLDCAMKGKYHAWCVMAGNFTTILWQECFKTMSEDMGISETHLVPYMDQIIHNIKSDTENALTGPLARKDLTTITNNIESIPDAYKQLYRAFLGIKGIELESTDENSI